MRAYMTTRFTGWFGLLVAALLPWPLVAQDTETPEVPEALSSLISQHRYPMSGSHGALAGEGLRFLVERAAESEFVMIGESHLMTEVPLLTGRLMDELRPAGFDAFAVETGPAITPVAVELLSSGLEAFREHVEAYPFTMPFYEQVPEAELMERAIGQGYQIWGLDQEFIGSGRFWLDHLSEEAASEEARRLVEQWQEREREGVRHFTESQSSERLLLQVATPEDFAALRRTFTGNDAAVRIIDELATSARIYQLWREHNYENNRRRVEYLKRNLVRHLDEFEESAGRPAKVIGKFGSVHAALGYTTTNQLDLGNMAHELAIRRGGASLHIQLTALGMRNAAGGFVDWVEAGAPWGPLAPYVGEGPWTVFDLRPLRAWFHSRRNREAFPDLADAVFRYDLVAITPEFTRSEAIAEQLPTAGG